MATQPPGTGLTLFNSGAALPAYMQEFVDDVGTNVQSRSTVPSLSPEGKTWTIVIDGQKTRMQRRNTDGDLEPLPIMKVIVLNWNQQRGRAYYEGTYDPNNVSAPVCWSDDGVEPDNSLPGPYSPQQMIDLKIEAGASRKISEKCASCPMAVKGSKVIPGTNKAITACSQHRMLAVLPDPAMGLPEALVRPLRLKIAMTSDWDKESPQEEAQGWLSWSRYVDWLNTRNCKNTALIATKMKFDTAAAFPKIFFASERLLQPEELNAVRPLVVSEDTKKLLGGTWTPAGPDGVRKEQQVVATPQVAGEPETTDQPPAVAAAAPPPAVLTGNDHGCPAGYMMNPTETHSYKAYIEGGWTDEQLITNGKLIAAAPPPAEPEVVAAPTPAPAPAPVVETVVVAAPAGADMVVEDRVVVGESAAGAPSATSEAPKPAPAEGVVVVAEAASEPSPALAAPAAVVVQEPAQAPAPAPTPQAPDPPAAAAAAAEAVPAVSTEVPADVADLLNEWK